MGRFYKFNLKFDFFNLRNHEDKDQLVKIVKEIPYIILPEENDLIFKVGFDDENFLPFRNGRIYIKPSKNLQLIGIYSPVESPKYRKKGLVYQIFSIIPEENLFLLGNIQTNREIQFYTKPDF